MTAREAFPTWADFARNEPELAAFAERRLEANPSYMATIQPDGRPRVHPTSARVKGGRLALYMYPSSPKGHDLRRDPRFALHTAVDDHDGGGGEVAIEGRARVIDDQLMAEFGEAGFPPMDGYIVFELSVERVLVAEYPDPASRASFRRWRWSPEA